MSFVTLRNHLIEAIYEYMRIPVVLADQVDPELEFPFIIYSVVTPYAPANTMGHYQETAQGDFITEIRREDPTCVLSFTVCSQNRKPDGQQIYGEDEAMAIAEKLQGWFLHSGYDSLAGCGAVVDGITNAQPRSFLQVDEEARRWGFDVTIRYVRTDERAIETIEKVNIKEVKDSE